MQDARTARRARRARRAASLGLVAAGFATLGLVLKDAARPTRWEARVITTARRSPPFWAHGWISLFGRGPFVAIMLGLAGVALLTRQRRLALAGTVGCTVAVVAAEHVFKRLLDGAYPSGHVTAAAACATFAWCIASARRRARVPGPLVALLLVALLSVPLIVAWAAVAEGTHYPADAAGGLLLGFVAVGAASLAAHAPQAARVRPRVAPASRASA